MIKILIESTSIERYNFFRRLAKTLTKLNCQIIFITNDLNVYFKSQTDNFKVYLIKKTFNNNIPVESDVSKSVNVLSGWINLKEAESLYRDTINLAQKLNNTENFDIFFMGFGWYPTEMAMRDFANKNNIKTLFFEIANIPNKIFVDKLGSNAASALYLNTDILDNFDSDEEEFNIWKDNYLKSKTKIHNVPQAKLANKSMKKLVRISRLLKFLLNNLLFISYDMRPNPQFFVKKSKIRIEYDDLDCSQEKYLFFPMQVNNDTQILLNSDINLIEAIEKVSDIAKRKDLKLLIKPHPAESDQDFIKKIYSLKEKYNFSFINENTFHLIKYAQEVITINSTVGLESMILGKPVTFLGRSFFSRFNKKYLRNYIMNYLIDADYFGNQPISDESARKILKFAD